ncbi:hypothetical protein [Euzebya pacifica]|nr:hypothetical protein [Euzebya pacifica]
MTILTTTNQIVCDDHALYECDTCVVNEVAIGLDGPAAILDLRDFDLAALTVPVDVIELPARRTRELSAAA